MVDWSTLSSNAGDHALGAKIMPHIDDAVDALFAGKNAVVRRIYDRLWEGLGRVGPFHAEAKTTSIHLVHRSSFAGIHPRKSSLLLTLRTDRPIDSPRVVKREQVSRSRWHNDLKLTAPDEVDDELVGWLVDAYTLSGPATRSAV